MVQVIQRPPKRPGVDIGQLIIALAGLGKSGYDTFQQKKALQAENAALAKQGIDVTGISDPKIRAELISSQLKGQQKQDFINKLSGAFSAEPDIGPPNVGVAPEGGLFAKQRSQKAQQPTLPDFSKLSEKDILEASALDKSFGDTLRSLRDTAIREKRAERELSLQERKASPEFQRESRLESAQAQADVKYNQELQAGARQHELKAKTLNRLEELNKQGVTGKPYEKLLEKYGLVNLTSEGRREFAAEQKNLITDIRSILGAQFTGFEFQTILNAYPSPDFSKDANAAIIKNLKEFQDIKAKEVEFANQIKKENGGKIPNDFQTKVNERVREYALSKLPNIKENTRKILNEEYGVPSGKTLMLDPQGNPLHVPIDEIEKYMNLGAQMP